MQPILNSIWFAKMINTYKVLFFFKGNEEDIDKFILSTGFMGIKALNEFEYFLYLFINSKRFHKIKDTLVQGAVQEAVTVVNVKNIQIVLPSSEILTKFNQLVEPLITKAYKLKKENQILASLRDLLLPKLMSGEVRIPD
jgi:type I restriction enzyme S subunit